MKFFLDTANPSEIESLLPTGMVNGVTTNPTLIMKSGQPFKDVIQKICNLVAGPVSAEVTSTSYEDMLHEGRELSKLASNVVVKLPITVDGLRVCHELTQDNIATNMTLCFSANQALLAAKAGASFVSPFVGRLDDTGYDGLELVHDILSIFDQYSHFDTEVLVASVRHPLHVTDAAKMGADAITLPPKILRQLFDHPLTTSGVAQFMADWQKTIKG